jgi:hypothetical protein
MERAIVAKAFQDGANPAERLYAFAENRGYKPKSEAASDKLDMIAKGLETEMVKTKGIQFTPVEGPQRKADAKLGLVFFRKEQFDAGITPLHIVIDYLGVRQLILPGTWATATYNGVLGGLL